MTTRSPLAKLQALLRALEEPDAGAWVHGLHAPEALLPVGGGLLRAGDIPAEIYAQAFMADDAVYQDVRPGKSRGPVIVEVVEASAEDVGEGRLLVWFSATEQRTQMRLHIVMALAPAGIMAVTLAPARTDWDWDTTLEQTHADYAYGRGLFPRGWLDVAWQRLYGHARPRVLALPEAAFACQGSGDCCKIDWPISVDAGYQHVLDGLDWGPRRPDLQGLQLPVLDDGRLAVKRADARCPFLDVDDRCAVHRKLGRPLFPTCALYPFSYAATPDGLAFSTSSQCGAARAGLGPKLVDSSLDLRDRVAMADMPPLRTPVYRLVADQTVPWPAFKATEAALLDALATDEPFALRLWDGTQALLTAVNPLLHWEPELPPVVPVEQRATIAAFLGPWLEHLALNSEQCLPRDAVLSESAMLARVLRNLHWSKVLSFHFDLATSHTVGVAMWLLVRHAVAQHGTVPERLWAEMGKMFMHGAAMRPYLGDDDEARARRTMLGDPLFAAWLLGY